MDDFTLDGFEDLFIMSDVEALAASASDVTSINEGMVFGPTTPLSSAGGSDKDLVTGDFNADGLIDVAWLSGVTDVYGSGTVISPQSAPDRCPARSATASRH